MDETHYITVDLEIKSKDDLSPLVDSFGEDVILIYNGKWEDHYLAAFESIGNYDVNGNINYFLHLIDKLEGIAKELWSMSSYKIFDIGFQCGCSPFSYQLMIDPSTTESLAQHGATVGITIYSKGNGKGAANT